jgi:valyl-tRNA synthetase
LARTEGYRNFCNKLWNAARYVLMNTEEHDCGLRANVNYSHVDRWIVARLNQVISTTSHAIDNYRFDLAAQAIYDFTWNEYCDWYLELTKVALQSDNEAIATWHTQNLVACFGNDFAFSSSDYSVYHRRNLATCRASPRVKPCPFVTKRL